MLLQQAGNQKVFEFHGNAATSTCMMCHEQMPTPEAIGQLEDQVSLRLLRPFSFSRCAYIEQLMSGFFQEHLLYIPCPSCFTQSRAGSEALVRGSHSQDVLTLEWFVGCTTSTQDSNVPKCKICDGVMKMDVVLFGEALKSSVVEGAMAAAMIADVVLVVGTSLTVRTALMWISFSWNYEVRLSIFSMHYSPIPSNKL